jgi:hypothetical protein
MSSVDNISALTAQTAAVSPMRTTALPLECVREPVFTDAGRNCDLVRPLTRTEGREFGSGGER